MSALEKTREELARRILRNFGRCCTVTLKRTGEVVTVIRMGTMKEPDEDNYKLLIDGEMVAQFDDLKGVALWMLYRR